MKVNHLYIILFTLANQSDLYNHLPQSMRFFNGYDIWTANSVIIFVMPSWTAIILFWCSCRLSPSWVQPSNLGWSMTRYFLMTPELVVFDPAQANSVGVAKPSAGCSGLPNQRWVNHSTLSTVPWLQGSGHSSQLGLSMYSHIDDLELRVV